VQFSAKLRDETDLDALNDDLTRHLLNISSRDLELIANPGGLMNLHIYFGVRGRVILGCSQSRLEAAAGYKPVHLPVQARGDFTLMLCTGRRYANYREKFSARVQRLRETIAEGCLKAFRIGCVDEPIRILSSCKTGSEP
jgi:hypothetical protein